MKQLKGHFHFILLFIIAAALRLIFLFRDKSFYWDEAVYLSMADAFSGNFYFFEYIRPPLWPLILSVLPKTLFASKALSATFSIITILAVYFLSLKVLDKKKAFYISFFYAVNHFSMFFAGLGLTETNAALLVFLTLLTFYGATENNKKSWWILSGVFMGLGIATRHMAAYFIFPVILYLLYMKKLSFLKEKGFWLFLISTVIVISPWLIWMWILFGNPFYAQLTNLPTSVFTPPQIYIESLPVFLGIQGLLIIPTLLLARKNRFVALNIISIVVGIFLLSLVSHKEVRYLFIVLPQFIILEGIGLFWLVNRFKASHEKSKTILVGILALILVLAFIFVPVQPRDTALQDCMRLSEPYINGKVITSMKPFFAFEYKKGFLQLPFEIEKFTCDEIKKGNPDFLIYYRDWFYREVEDQFLAGTSSCLEKLHETDTCVVYSVK